MYSAVLLSYLESGFGHPAHMESLQTLAAIIRDEKIVLLQREIGRCAECKENHQCNVYKALSGAI